MVLCGAGLYDPQQGPVLFQTGHKGTLILQAVKKQNHSIDSQAGRLHAHRRSHQNSQLKPGWAGLVLGWVISWESPVLYRTPFQKMVQWSEDVIKADPFFGRSRVRFRVPPWGSNAIARDHLA